MPPRSEIIRVMCVAVPVLCALVKDMRRAPSCGSHVARAAACGAIARFGHGRMRWHHQGGKEMPDNTYELDGGLER